MQIFMFTLAAIFVARYLDRKNKILSVIHTAFFFTIFSLSLFTTDMPFLSSATERIFGDYYAPMRHALMSVNGDFISSFATMVYVTLSMGACLLFAGTLRYLGKLKFKEAFRRVRHIFPPKRESFLPIFQTNKNLFLRLCRIID